MVFWGAYLAVEKRMKGEESEKARAEPTAKRLAAMDVRMVLAAVSEMLPSMDGRVAVDGAALGLMTRA